jgi:mannose-1-phosphate guanylyltransferase
MNITPVILSGGSGTRLWPLSRKSSPKQFLRLVDNKSLFQKTALRIVDKNTFTPPIIICNNEHRFAVADELQKSNIESLDIILEPIGRNTAPAIAIAALDIVKKSGDGLMLVMPSDHLIENEKAFLQAVKNAGNLAQEDYLITFGIVPNIPETGYGYIKKSAKINELAFGVERFVEKPDEKTAKEFLNSGEFLWNSGIFLFKASTYLEILQKNNYEIFSNCQIAYKNAKKDLDFIRLDEKDFEKCPNISADYAVMEKAEKIAVVPVDIGWSDIGNWSALSDVSSKDDNKNSLIGDVMALGSNNCYIKSKYGMVAAIGVKDLIIVSLKDVVLVANKNNAQDVKKLYEILKNNNRQECENHPKTYRPWGSFETIDVCDGFKVKKITVKPGGSLSLQMHHKRAEHWIIVSGVANVTCGEKQFILNEDQSTYIPIGQKHCLENKESTTLEIIEVQTGNYLGEDDIVRFSDIYGRV